MRSLALGLVDTTESEIPTVVWLRDQMRLALLERLQIVRGRYAPVKDVEPHLDQIANNAHELLPVIMAETPSRDLTVYPGGESMLSVLSHPSIDPTVESWRRAAASITIANHDLDQGDDQPWLRRHGPHWQLIEDAATAIEAFLVLDDRLEAMGALRSHSFGGRQFTLRGARTLTSAIAREAAWGADTSADLVAARQQTGPVQVVRGPDDLISRSPATDRNDRAGVGRPKSSPPPRRCPPGSCRCVGPGRGEQAAVSGGDDTW